MFFSLFIQTQLIPQNQKCVGATLFKQFPLGEPGNFSTYSLNSEREEYFFRNAEEEGCSANNAAQKMISQRARVLDLDEAREEERDTCPCSQTNHPNGAHIEAGGAEAYKESRGRGRR
jgi:hypothetical protein